MTSPERIRDLMLESHPRPDAGPYVDWEDVLRRAGARARHRRPGWALRRVAVIAALVVAVTVVALTGPFGGEKVDVLDRALAAVGAGPVVHAVVEYSWPQDLVVDLATGEERERVHRDAFWYDERRRRLLHRSTTDGGEPGDYLISGAALSVRLDPALAGFATRYRDALESEAGRVVGDATVDGRQAKRIQFRPDGGGAVEEVLVDAATYVPLSFQSTYPGGRRSPVWRVLAIESMPYDPSLFEPASSKPHVRAGEVSEAREITAGEAARALGAPPLWLGAAFAGHTLASVELSRTTAWLTDDSTVSGVLVRLVYGPVRVSLARDRGGSYALGFGDDAHPVPPEGSLAVTGNDRDGWQGQLRQSGFAVMLSAPGKEQLLTAARSLTRRP